MAELQLIETPWVDPMRALQAARGLPGRVLLDSGGEIGRLSRWSVLVARPLETVEASVGVGLAGGPVDPDPFDRLGDLHRRWRARCLPSGEDHQGFSTGEAPERGSRRTEDDDGDEALRVAAPFTGGVVGLLGYDSGRAVERLPARALDDPSLPDLWAAVYDGAIVFDRARRRAFVTSWGLVESATRPTLLRVLESARGEAALPSSATVEAPPVEISDDAGREEFLEGVRRIREEIARGEIYQANLTRRVVLEIPTDAPDADRVYERLRAMSPTPFGAYVDAGRFRLLSASPERFVRIDRDLVETRPIKGTRRRGRDDLEDAALRRELLSSSKDAAELLMIVDLERNDLGRVSRTGTVSVDELSALESYSSVFHLVATVRGRLRHGTGPEQVLRATFPGGSVTGAPKVRAMGILEDLEAHRRKFAMGSLVAWDFRGAFDSSILIRTIVMRSGEAVFNVGAGIVADSDPELEYMETVAKAAPLLAATERA